MLVYSEVDVTYGCIGIIILSVHAGMLVYSKVDVTYGCIGIIILSVHVGC